MKKSGSSLSIVVDEIMKHGGGSVDEGNIGFIKGMMFVGGTKGMMWLVFFMETLTDDSL